MEKIPHIAILPSPGMGHLIPLAEFARRLVLHHNFSVTFIIPSDAPPSKSQLTILDTLPKSINSVFLPPVNFDDLPDGVKIETRISLTVSRSLSSLRETFNALTAKTHLVALVVDLFGTDAFDVAIDFKISPYIFFPSTAMTLSFFLHLPKLHESVTCEYRNLPEPVKIPGCIPIHGKDLLDPVQDRQDEAYTWLVHHVKRYRMAEGILVNSFMELERGALKGLLEEDGSNKPPVYPVGPLIRREESGRTGEGSDCLRWLDDQPSGSVLYVSFGSGGTLSNEELHELALGLEVSEQRFLWVVRSPNEKEANANFFSVESKKDPFDFLPEGFVERTKGLGLVVPSWAPQIQVLSHGSTGGFLTHCGWNSTLESVVYGVPLIAWPLYAEQKMNAKILVEDLKVALRAREGEVVEREEIGKVVKSLMEGEEGKRVRNRMRELKDGAAKALGEDGSSTKSLSDVARKWSCIM